MSDGVIVDCPRCGQTHTENFHNTKDGDLAERIYQAAKIKTGLCDSNGIEIMVGDELKKPVDCNNEVHGDWAVYEVVQKGLTPVISYVRSEKGDILPAGYLAAPLCDEYDRKMFCFTKDSLRLRPIDNIEILKA